MYKIILLMIAVTTIICYELTKERIEYEPAVSQTYHHLAFENAIKHKKFDQASAILKHKLKELHMRTYLQQAQAHAINEKVTDAVSQELKKIWLFISTETETNVSEKYRLQSLHEKLQIAEQRIYQVVAKHKKTF